MVCVIGRARARMWAEARAAADAGCHGDRRAPAVCLLTDCAWPPAPATTRDQCSAPGPQRRRRLYLHSHTQTMEEYAHTDPFNGPLSGTTQVSQYQKGKTNQDFTEARDSEWQRHQLGHMQVCTSLQTDNHASTPPLSFSQAGCPSCRPTNSIKALKAYTDTDTHTNRPV